MNVLKIQEPKQTKTKIIGLKWIRTYNGGAYQCGGHMLTNFKEKGTKVGQNLRGWKW